MDDDVKGMLDDREARVLGCLMEKQMTTPEYYPLTLKALTMACNQKSSRNPVMGLSEGEVSGALSGLRSRGLVTARTGGRADRYEQHLSRALGIDTKQRAVLCVLMLRGLLTLNEIRINTSRMVEFDSAEALQQVLDELSQRDEPLLQRIPRAAGQREDRFAQLLSGEPERSTMPVASPTAAEPTHAADLEDRIERLELEVAGLRNNLQTLLDSSPNNS